MAAAARAWRNAAEAEILDPPNHPGSGVNAQQHTDGHIPFSPLGTKESPWAHGLTPILLIGERLAAALSLALRTTLAQLCPPQLVHQTKRFVHAIQTAAPMQLATRLLEQERRALFPPLEIVTQPVDVEVLPAEEQPKRIYLKQLCLPECSSNPDM